MGDKIDKIFEAAKEQSEKTTDFLSPKEKFKRRKEFVKDNRQVLSFSFAAGAIFGGGAKASGMTTGQSILTGISATVVTAGVGFTALAKQNLKSDTTYRNIAAETFDKTAKEITQPEQSEQPTQEQNKELTTEDAFANSVTRICAEAIRDGKTIDQNFVARTKTGLGLAS